MEEYSDQSENLPKLATSATPSIPRRPLVRHAHPAEGQMHTDASHDPSASSVQGTVICTLDVGVNTDCDELSRLEHRVQEVEKEVSELKAGPFRLENIKSDDSKVGFYTGFPSYTHLKACVNFFRTCCYESAVQGHIRSVCKGGKMGRSRHHWRNISLRWCAYKLGC